MPTFKTFALALVAMIGFALPAKALTTKGQKTWVKGPLVKKLDAACQKIVTKSMEDYVDPEDSGVTTVVKIGQAEWHNCQDKYFNLVYKAALAKLSKADQKKLVLSERAWIEARDKACDKASEEMKGGTWESILYGNCLIDETDKRIKWLQKTGGKVK